MSGWPLWRERWRTWAPAALFFAANLGALALYQFVYANRVVVLGERVATLQGRLQGLREQSADLQAKVDRVESNRARIAELYRDRFATEKQRLTKTLAEFKALASKAGLQPESVSYPEQDLAEFGLVKKSIIFGVDGGYDSLRQLLHALASTPTFLSLEEVRLSGQGNQDPRLSIQLRISTLFVGEEARALPEPPEPARPAPAPAPPPAPARPAASPAEEAGG